MRVRLGRAAMRGITTAAHLSPAPRPSGFTAHVRSNDVASAACYSLRANVTSNELQLPNLAFAQRATQSNVSYVRAATSLVLPHSMADSKRFRTCLSVRRSITIALILAMLLPALVAWPALAQCAPHRMFKDANKWPRAVLWVLSRLRHDDHVGSNDAANSEIAECTV